MTRSAPAVALTASLALGTAACSKKNNSTGTDTGPVTVVLQYFGSPGFDQAVKDFQAANPNIKVDVQNMGQLKDFQPKLVQWLAAGKGAGDLVMLEEGTLLGYLQDHKNFANLLDLGAGSLKDDYLPYKWQNGFTSDGKKLVGLGSDLMAAGGLRALRERGRAVPADVAVVGFEDSAIAHRTEPPLTTVHQSVDQMGREMARLLLARIAGEEAGSTVLDTYLIVRESA